MAYVYTHTRIDSNEVFYVGISQFSDPYIRAYTTHKRNQFWKNIVVKAGGFKVTIIEDNLSWQDACKKERELISLYGRRDLKTGTLCNWTAGGEGSNGALVSEETKRKITLGKTGKKRPPVTDATRKKLSASMAGKTPANFTTLHSRENRAKSAQSNIKNYSAERKKSASLRWKVNNPRSVPIINTITKEVFYKQADVLINIIPKIHRTTFSKMLNGKIKNITNYAYANKE